MPVAAQREHGAAQQVDGLGREVAAGPDGAAPLVDDLGEIGVCTRCVAVHRLSVAPAR
jgi:hypothetical protein